MNIYIFITLITMNNTNNKDTKININKLHQKKPIINTNKVDSDTKWAGPTDPQWLSPKDLHMGSDPGRAPGVEGGDEPFVVLWQCYASYCRRSL